jgi:hypothetical protein
MADAPREPAGSIPNVDPSNLTDEQRMLIGIRDTLYEGSWDDFAHDLIARRDAKPHVFDILPATDTLRETIATHLAQIDRLRAWEQTNGVTLRAER